MRFENPPSFNEMVRRVRLILAFSMDGFQVVIRGRFGAKNLRLGDFFFVFLRYCSMSILA